MKKVLVSLTIAAIVLGALLLSRENSHHRLHVKTYFQNAQDIKRGTAVWVDGVQVGSVTDVRLRAELKERPVEISIVIITPYELIIPNDSIARVAAQGVLGPTAVNIDTHGAQGSAITNDGIVKSDKTELSISKTGADVMEKVGNVLIEEAKTLRRPKQSSAAPAK